MEMVSMQDNTQRIETSIMHQQDAADVNKSPNSMLDTHNVRTLNNDTVDQMTPQMAPQTLYVFLFQY
jgi:hypothetical protein